MREVELVAFGLESLSMSASSKVFLKLALGTVQFGLPYGIANHVGQVTRTAAKDMLSLAIANGIDTLDTAIAYGESEQCLGEIGVQQFKLMTKLPAVPDNCVDITGWVKKQFSESLNRLDVSAVYGLLLHCPLQLLERNGLEIYRAMRGLQEAGQVQKIGISIYSPSELDKLIPIYKFDLVQAPFNLIDRRLDSSGWLYKLKDHGVEIHTRSVFLQGLLLMSRNAIPQNFSPWASLWDKWHEWLSSQQVSAVDACLAFPLSFSEVDRIVVGVDSVNQLKQIIKAATTRKKNESPDLSCESENLVNPSCWLNT